MIASSAQARALTRQDSFDMFTSWVLDKPQVGHQAASFSSAPLLPLGRTASFQEVLEDLEHATEDSNTTASSHTGLNLSHTMDTTLADFISTELEEEVDPSPVPSKPKKKIKPSPEERLKIKTKKSKTFSRDQRDKNKFKLNQLATLAEKDPFLKAQIDKIESSVKMSYESERASAKKSLPKDISSDEKKRRLNVIASRCLRQKKREKMNLLKSYLATPTLAQEGAAAPLQPISESKDDEHIEEEATVNISSSN
ncbi:MAG: hypothetical protein ACK5PQ_00110 [Alphaproteobacteria bacterium]